MDTASKIMPPDREAWSSAMIAEYEVLPTDHERRQFALGYLATSLAAFSTTPKGISILGRTAIGAAFVSLALWCLHEGLGLIAIQDVFASTFVGLSGLYLIIGTSAFSSAKLTQRLSFASALGACIAVAGLHFKAIPIPIEASLFAKALASEVIVVLTVTGIVALILNLLDPQSADNTLIA
jgi:hypothetical protein